jgi:hypothetical protein
MADQGSGQQWPAGWKKDPSGRHYGRYWDGQQWTEHVISSDKVQSIDPLPPRPEPSLHSDAPADEQAPTRVVSTPTTTMPSVESPTTVMRSSGGVLMEERPAGHRTGAWASVRAWPRWAKWTAGSVVALVILVAATADQDEDTPVSVVGQVETTLTLPVATTPAPTTTVLATTIPPTTQAPTTVTTPDTTRATTAATAPATTAATAPATTRSSSVSYANCAAVKAAGAAPIYRGQPGYGSHLDRDNDGIGCET